MWSDVESSLRQAPSMPDRTPCVHCGKAGFVRREHVIQGGKVMTTFYCGACNRSWQIEDKDSGDPAKPRIDDERQRRR